MKNKTTITDFLGFISRSEKKEKIQIRAGIVDKSQPLIWEVQEIKALFFILGRHGYDSTRVKLNTLKKKIEGKDIKYSNDLFF